MLLGVLSRSGGEVGASSALSVCGIPLLTGEGGGDGLTGGVPEVAAVTGDRTIFRFLLDRVSIVRAAAAVFPATAGWGHATLLQLLLLWVVSVLAVNTLQLLLRMLAGVLA